MAGDTRRGVDGGVDGRLTIREAALSLGISEGAVRKRVDRGTLEHMRGKDGRIYVVLPDGVDEGETASTTFADDAGEARERLIKFLSEQLEHEREVNRENRRIIAGLVQRIPALEEAPTEPPGAPQTASEGPASGTDRAGAEQGERRSWWREFFGLQ